MVPGIQQGIGTTVTTSLETDTTAQSKNAAATDILMVGEKVNLRMKRRNLGQFVGS